MKWAFVVLAVFVLPWSAYAERSAASAKVNMLWYESKKPTPPYVLRFQVSTNQSIENIRASMHLYVQQKNPLDAVKKGWCMLWVNQQLRPDLRDSLIHGEDGPKLWFSHLGKEGFAVLLVVWKKKDPHLEYATVSLESDTGTSSDIWQSGYAEWFFQKRPVTERKTFYRELSLDDVCENYSVKPLEGL